MMNQKLCYEMEIQETIGFKWSFVVSLSPCFIHPIDWRYLWKNFQAEQLQISKIV